jgi:peptidoglycan/LPS O-acetylase OafA/YrhL
MNVVFMSGIIVKTRNFVSTLGDEITFDALYNPKDNAFDFFRFSLASLVIYSHAYPLLYGTSVPEIFARITYGQETFGGLAVAGFFSISGFLVTQSFLHSNSYLEYIIKRFLRLFPALIVSSFITAFLLGPLLSEFPVREFLLGNYGESPIGYFVKNSTLNLLGFSYTLRDLFMTNPYPAAVNGSLWTIKHEFVAYITVMGLGYFSFFKHRKLLLAYTGLVVSVYFANYHSGFMLWNSKWWAFHSGEYLPFFKLLAFFLFGSILYVWKDKVVFSWNFLLLATLFLFWQFL